MNFEECAKKKSGLNLKCLKIRENYLKSYNVVCDRVQYRTTLEIRYIKVFTAVSIHFVLYSTVPCCTFVKKVKLVDFF